MHHSMQIMMVMHSMPHLLKAHAIRLHSVHREAIRKHTHQLPSQPGHLHKPCVGWEGIVDLS